jgi:hypothetical protein
MKPITIALRKVQCQSTTSGPGSDEPYVVVFAADMSTTPPGAQATLYGPWDDVDSGETATTIPILPLLPPDFVNTVTVFRRNCWGIGRQPAVISNPADAIILVALMENDDGNPGAAESVVQTFLFASIISSLGAHLSRSALVARLKEDMASALKLTGTGFPSSDDPIGGIEELVLTAADLAAAAAGSTTKKLQFSGDGGKYTLVFGLQKTAAAVSELTGAVAV